MLCAKAVVKSNFTVILSVDGNFILSKRVSSIERAFVIFFNIAIKYGAKKEQLEHILVNGGYQQIFSRVVLKYEEKIIWEAWNLNAEFGNKKIQIISSDELDLYHINIDN